MCQYGGCEAPPALRPPPSAFSALSALSVSVSNDDRMNNLSTLLSVSTLPRAAVHVQSLHSAVRRRCQALLKLYVTELDPRSSIVDTVVPFWVTWYWRQSSVTSVLTVVVE